MGRSYSYVNRPKFRSSEARATFEAMYECESCGKGVRPASDLGIVHARELLPGAGFGGNPGDVIEGRHVYFHADCYPVGSIGYRQTPMPPGITDD